MSEFGKTLIVDPDLSIGPNYPSPPYYNTIKEAVWQFDPQNGSQIADGGTVIVESGTYRFDEEDDYTTNDNWNTTVYVPSNVSIIGRGNAEIEVTENVHAFVNAGQLESPRKINERIKISGLTFKVALTSGAYTKHLIYMKNVHNSVIEKLYIKDVSAAGVYHSNTPAAISFNGEEHQCKGNIIQNCIIENFGKNYEDGGLPIYHYGYGIFMSTDCSNNFIRNNIIQNCRNSIYISINSCGNVITNNIFKDSGVLTYRLNDEDEVVLETTVGSNFLITKRSHNNVISGNIILGSRGSHGLYMTGSEGNTICGNISNENYDSGIKLRYSVDENAADQIIAEYPCKYDAIVGNICTKNGYFIKPDGTIGVNPLGANGIFLQAFSQYNTVSGNACFDNISNDIRVQTETIENVEYEFETKTVTYESIDNILTGNVCNGVISSGGNDCPDNLAESTV